MPVNVASLFLCPAVLCQVNRQPSRPIIIESLRRSWPITKKVNVFGRGLRLSAPQLYQEGRERRPETGSHLWSWTWLKSLFVVNHHVILHICKVIPFMLLSHTKDVLMWCHTCVCSKDMTLSFLLKSSWDKWVCSGLHSNVSPYIRSPVWESGASKSHGSVPLLGSDWGDVQGERGHRDTDGPGDGVLKGNVLWPAASRGSGGFCVC